MAYRKDTDRIVAGGMSLLPPVDKTPPPDSPFISNFRVDQAGVLRSALGIRPNATGLPGAVHSLFRVGEARYGGVGSQIRNGPNLANVVYSGLDGRPVSFCAFDEFIWSMHPQKALRIENVTAHNAGIAAPVSPVGVSPGGQGSQLVTEFDQGEFGWHLYRWVGTEAVNDPMVPEEGGGSHPALWWDAEHKQSGTHSLRIESNPEGRYQLRRDFPGGINLTIDNEPEDKDEFQFWFYITDPAALDSLSITFRSGDGRAVTAYVPPIRLSPEVYTWNRLRINRGFDVYSLTQGNATYQDIVVRLQVARDAENVEEAEALEQSRAALLAEILAGSLAFADQSRAPGDPSQFTWHAVESIWIEIVTNNACDVHFDKMEVVGGIAGALQGELFYFTTYGNDVGHESNPSPISEAVNVNRQSVQLFNIPRSQDPQVTKRHIYRLGGGLNEPLLVTTIDDNITTVRAELTPNDTAQRDRIPMPVDAHLPPPAYGMVGPYLGHLIAFRTDRHPNRYFWTPVAEPWKWPGSDDDLSGNWQDCGDEREAILAVTLHKNYAVFYKERSIWRLGGSPDDFDHIQTNAQAGVFGPRAVVAIGTVDYYGGTEGIFRFNGDFETDISGPIKPIFRGQYADLGHGLFIPPLNLDFAHTCVIGAIAGELWFSYPEGGANTPTVTLVCDLESGNWALRRTNAALGFTGFTSFMYEGPANYLMGGTANGGLYELRVGVTDGGQPILAEWQSRYRNQGLANNEKRYADLVIDYRTAQAAEPLSALTVRLYANNGEQEYVLGSIFSSIRTTAVFPIPAPNGEGILAFNAAVHIGGAVTSTVEIYGIYLHYYAENRRGRAFDTGVFDMGQQVGQSDLIELETTAAQPIRWTLLTDLPGGTIQQRQIGTVPARTRGVHPITIPVTEGRRGRILLTSTGLFQVHDMNMRIRDIGEYVDGSSGQYWKTLEFRVGDGRVVELKDLLIEYEAGAPTPFEIYSDMPGGVMALRKAVMLPATNGVSHSTYVIQCDGIFGTMFQLVAKPPSTFKLYSGTLRWRPVGVYVNGAGGDTWEVGPLDLGQPHQLRNVEMHIDTDGSMLLTVSLELPSYNVITRDSWNINTEVTTGGQRPWNERVDGNIKGQLLRLQLSGGGVARVYGARVYCRLLGEAANWKWLEIPVPKTPDLWSTAALPIQPTSQAYRWIQFPMDVAE